MAVKVKFRFNKLTGEVEEFLVEQDQETLREQHDQAHEQLAAEIGRLIERFPRVSELTGGAAADAVAATEPDQGLTTGEQDTAEEPGTVTENRRRGRA